MIPKYEELTPKKTAAYFHSSPDGQKEVEAFFSLPRPRFYLYVVYFLLSFALLLGSTWGLIQLNRDDWIPALWSLGILLGTAKLARSESGRGCLRAFGPGRIPLIGRYGTFEPKTQIVVWSLITFALALIAISA